MLEIKRYVYANKCLGVGQGKEKRERERKRDFCIYLGICDPFLE